MTHERQACFPQHSRRIRTLCIVTDTWTETNGVTTTLRQTVALARAQGYTCPIVYPELFPRVLNPLYRQYRHAVPSPWRLRDILLRARPDAVHIVTEGPLGFAARHECLRRGWRYTTSFHTRWDQHCKHLLSVPTPLVWKWLRWFHAPSVRVLAPAPSIMRLLRAQGFPGPLGLWQRGIDRELFRPRPKTHQAVRRPIMLYVGRVSREKNLADFLDADVDGTKYVVGEGPLLAPLQRMYQRQVAAGRVVFFGEQRGVELAQLYAEADVFVFPSTTDTFGNVILEALASGVPVAAYPVSGPIDILDGPGVGAMHWQLGLAIRDALAQGRPAACVALAERYTWEAATAQFLQAIVHIGSTPRQQPVTRLSTKLQTLLQRLPRTALQVLYSLPSSQRGKGGGEGRATARQLLLNRIDPAYMSYIKCGPCHQRARSVARPSWRCWPISSPRGKSHRPG